MWVVLKFNKKKLEFLKKDLEKKSNKKFIFYYPKLKFLRENKSKIEISLLGDYLFCFNEDFKDRNFINTLFFTRGLKYFLNGHIHSQDTIKWFIKKCKQFEDSEGYLDKNIFDLLENKNYKFLSGPFCNQIFSVLNIQKHKINILIGKLKTSLEKEKYLIYPI